MHPLTGRRRPRLTLLAAVCTSCLVMPGGVEAEPAKVRNGLIAYTNCSQFAELEHCQNFIKVVRPDGSGRRRLPCSLGPRDGQCADHNPVFSPDGRFLANSIEKRGAFPLKEVVVVRRPGRQARRPVAVAEEIIDDIAWSGDGTKLAYANQGRVRIVRLDDLSVRLFRKTLGDDIAWSRQGRLAWTSFERTGIFLTNRSRTRVARLPVRYRARPEWSPDGKLLLDLGTNDGVRIMRADGRGPRLRLRQCDNLNAPAVWSPDGRFVLCRSNNADVITVSIKTRRTRIVARSAGPKDFAWQPLPVARR